MGIMTYCLSDTQTFLLHLADSIGWEEGQETYAGMLQVGRSSYLPENLRRKGMEPQTGETTVWLFRERLCCLKLHGFSSESVDSKVSLTRELGFETSGYGS